MRALTLKQGGDLTAVDIMEDFGRFLRLHTADGDASPATATEDDIATYRRELVAKYEVGTVAVKLAAIRRLYEAAVWRGLR